MKKIALLDNYDSFTYNLKHLVEKVSDCVVDVYLNDKTDLDTLNNYENIILSPGPGLPSQAGIMPTALNQFADSKNILGVCLGMQAIGEQFKSPLKNLNRVMHGIATPVTHNNTDLLFKDIPVQFKVGRYHSWVIDQNGLNADLEVICRDAENEVMAIRHKQLNIRGVQFHPESILSEYGEQLMKNWVDYFTR